jgi:hypothetical protein
MRPCLSPSDAHPDWADWVKTLHRRAELPKNTKTIPGSPKFDDFARSNAHYEDFGSFDFSIGCTKVSPLDLEIPSVRAGEPYPAHHTVAFRDHVLYMVLKIRKAAAPMFYDCPRFIRTRTVHI